MPNYFPFFFLLTTVDRGQALGFGSQKIWMSSMGEGWLRSLEPRFPRL